MRNLSVLAALAPEISRQPLAVRKRINQAMLAYRERMIPYIPGAISRRSAPVSLS